MKLLLFNFHDIILLVTIYQSLLFAFLILVVPRNRHRSDWYFVFFLFIQAFIPFHLLVNYGDGFKFIALDISPNLYRIFEVAYWLEGPLLLWYTRSLVYKDFVLKARDFWFLTPAVVYLIWVTITFFSQDFSVRHAQVANHQYMDSSLGHHLTGVVREALRFAFGIACIVELKRCQKSMRDYYANLEEVNFSWLVVVVYGFLIIRAWALLLAVCLTFSAHTVLDLNIEAMGLTGNYATFLLVSSLIFFSLTRSKIFEGVVFSNDEDIKDEEKRSSATEADIDAELVNRLEQHMSANKPYLSHFLTLKRLSEQLDVSSRLLSNTINRHYQYNFFEFVNRYRIAEAQKILSDPNFQDMPIQEVLSQIGFNSRATFNTFFKKIVGSTPSSYRNTASSGSMLK